MTIDFSEHFWGEKHNGFDVLYHNMKYGQVASKELADFVRERSSFEEVQSKLLMKISKQANNGCINGSFAPLWQVLKISSERLSSLHQRMVQHFQDLVKDIQKYCDELHKKHKSIKEEEAGTLEVVQSIQTTTTMLLKAKELYHAKCIEVERLKRENASVKETEKAEVKRKKACEDYKSYLEKYTNIRDDFEVKMSSSSQHFQKIEEEHLNQMRTFLLTYTQVLENGHAQIGQVNAEFKQKCEEMTNDKLLEQFIKSKDSGIERPGWFVFEDADLSSLSQTQTPEQLNNSNNSDKQHNKKEGKKTVRGKLKTNRRTTSLLDLFFPTVLAMDPAGEPNIQTPSSDHCTCDQNREENLTRNAFRGSKWFLKSKRDKKKEKKAKKKKSDSKDDGEQKDDSQASTPVVDEEGFVVRPPDEDKHQYNDITNFYSSSEEESDDERDRKIRVEIKPLSNGSAPLSISVDELRASVGTLTLSPPVNNVSMKKGMSIDVTDATMHRSASSTSNQHLKPSNDLMGLNLFSPPTSTTSTPTGGIFERSKSPVISVETPTQNTEISALFEASQAKPPTVQANGSALRNGTPTTAIPRPQSRNKFENSSRGRMSPNVSQMSRTDSVGSLSNVTNDFKATSVPIGSSRGPSPLTIGMSDSIPIAVAFQEVVHAYFKGTEESRCQVKLVGEMMVSFPAGIVQVLTNNPTPAVLSFRIKNMNKIMNTVPNKQLISSESSGSDECVYEFNMTALMSLLRRQSEQAPTASYYNVDILKYQIKAMPGAKSMPLQLVTYWKCETNHTDLRCDYKYNPLSMSNVTPLTNISISVPVDGGVTNMQSKPSGTWSADVKRAVWKLPELSALSDGGGLGSLRARFDLSDGPSTPSTLSVQFLCEGTLISGVDFELAGLGYRLSLIKKRCIAGKYICEKEPSTAV